MGLPVLADAARSVNAGDVDTENLRAARKVCARYPNIALQEFPAEDQMVSLVYLTSGAGDAAANARWNAARSALGKSETAM